MPALRTTVCVAIAPVATTVSVASVALRGIATAVSTFSLHYSMRTYKKSLLRNIGHEETQRHGRFHKTTIQIKGGCIYEICTHKLSIRPRVAQEIP